MNRLINLIATAFLMALLAACGNNSDNHSSDATTVTVTDSEHEELLQEAKLEWAGTYAGTLPCASCPGIRTVIELKGDGQYQKQATYLESDMETKQTSGTMNWIEDGHIIEIDGQAYQLGEGRIYILDENNQVVSGEMADNYVLVKQAVTPHTDE